MSGNTNQPPQHTPLFMHSADPEAGGRPLTHDDLEMLFGRVMEMFAAQAAAGVLDAKSHSEHHAWVQAQIQRTEARARFWQNLADKSLPVILASLFIAAAGWAWSVASTHIQWNK
jgi:hypothetical protein